MAPTGGKPKADRDTVLGWMQRTGQNAAAAAREFNLSRETVKSWVRRYGPTASERAAAGGTQLLVNTDGGAKGEGSEGARTAPPAEPSRARPPAAPKPIVKLAPKMKEDLRNAADGLSSFLATAKDIAVEVEVIKADPKGDGGTIRVLDMQQYLHGAKALAQIIDIAKGTDAFDSDTGGTVESGNDEAKKLAAALGVKLPDAA